MKISLCAIVKNDELLVCRMLDSAVGVVDEIIIADTGSTDGTVAAIDAFSAAHPGLVKLLHFEWTGDFAEARNFTLAHADGEWIIVVDADESIDTQEAKALRPFLGTTTAHGVFITQRNYTGSMSNLGAVMDVDVVRVFRRGFTYEGRIHEQIAGDIRNHEGHFEKFPLHLHHVGYTEEYLRLKGKHERNLDLLKAELKDIPFAHRQTRWFHVSNLLAEYCAQQKWEIVASEARLLIEEIKKEKRQNVPTFTPRIYKFCINGLRFSGKTHDALRMCREAIQLSPKNTDLHMMQAQILMTMERYREAISVLLECRRIGDVKFDYVEYVEGNGTYIAAKHIGYCWLRLGDDLSALEWFVRAFEENPEQAGVIPWITLLTLDDDVLREMVKVIRTPQRFDEFIEYYAATGRDDAKIYMDEAEAKWGRRESIARARLAWQVRHGEIPTLPAEALEMDFVRLGLWHYEQGELEVAQTLWRQAGAAGEYFLRICEGASDQLSWEIRNVFPELMAVRATRFLTDFGRYIADLASVFVTILHTDLLAGFATQTFMERETKFVEEVEWNAQLLLSRGEKEKAHGMLKAAYLPDGELSVRAHLIQADAGPPTEQESVIRSARRVYPESRTLAAVWQAHFATPLPAQGAFI